MAIKRLQTSHFLTTATLGNTAIEEKTLCNYCRSRPVVPIEYTGPLGAHMQSSGGHGGL